MDLLIDNDIIIDLSSFDLCNQMIEAPGIQRTDIYITSSVRYSLGVIGRRVAKKEESFGKPTYDRMKSFLMGIQEICNLYDDQYRTLIENGGIGIDIGEATLMTAVCSDEFLIATGDKRSLKALAACGECRNTFDRIRGKVICLEQIILKIVQIHGIEYVRPRIEAATRIDKSVRFCFGVVTPASEASVIECLLSNIDHVNRESNNILAPVER